MTTAHVGLRATVVPADQVIALKQAQEKLGALLAGGVSRRSKAVLKLRREINDLIAQYSLACGRIRLEEKTQSDVLI